MDLGADADSDDESSDLLEPEPTTAMSPGLSADPQHVVVSKIPRNILEKYEVHSYRGAAVILSETNRLEFDEILDALSRFYITKEMIRTSGGNESGIPKVFSALLRPTGWHETAVQGDLIVRKKWKEEDPSHSPHPTYLTKSLEYRRDNYLDGHKVDYVKNRVALDLEWNSKDQTFDRDLYAFNAFSQCGVVDVGVVITRSAQLNPVFRELGPALDPDGAVQHKRGGSVRMTFEKYGASTTWMGKLLYRLNAGRNGACPVLAFGIRPSCISDWSSSK